MVERGKAGMVDMALDGVVFSLLVFSCCGCVAMDERRGGEWCNDQVVQEMVERGRAGIVDMALDGVVLMVWWCFSLVVPWVDLNGRGRELLFLLAVVVFFLFAIADIYGGGERNGERGRESKSRKAYPIVVRAPRTCFLCSFFFCSIAGLMNEQSSGEQIALFAV